MKRWMIGILLLSLVSWMSGCQKEDKIEYTKYTNSFFDTFDTFTQVIGYTETEEEFNQYSDQIYQRFQELHKLYDIYNNYEGINNLKTINDAAGKAPVVVADEIIDLLLFSKDWYEKGAYKTNIAMGSMLEIWHDYRIEGLDDPQNATLPDMDDLEAAAVHSNMDDIIIDSVARTVFLKDPKMRLNVGGVAKGYATELVAKEVMEAGLTSGMISAGGNIRVIGKPLDGVRERWGVGIQNPDKFIATDNENLLDVVFINDSSVVSSGDYQRYYIVDDKRIHHIIDPDSLMPETYYRAVTVITEDSGVADYVSKGVFLLPYDESRAFVEGLEGVEAIWVFADGRVEATDGAKKIMRSEGASGAKAK